MSATSASRIQCSDVPRGRSAKQGDEDGQDRGLRLREGLDDLLSAVGLIEPLVDERVGPVLHGPPLFHVKGWLLQP